MNLISVATLFAVETVDKIYRTGLELASAVGLPVDTWRAGDPTRSFYHVIATKLGKLDEANAEYTKAGFLSTVGEEWGDIVADEVYGVTRTQAGFASGDLVLTNTGGGLFEYEAGDLTFAASSTGKTYHSTTACTITPVGTAQVSPTVGPVVTVSWEADEAGSDSSVIADEIDTLVTTTLGVVVTSSDAGSATDKQALSALKEQCTSTLGALSPNGAPDAHEKVARDPELTGVADITRARTDPDDTTGVCLVYVASPTGPVAGASVTAAQTAIERWSKPLCFRPTVTNTVADTVDVEAEITGTDLPVGWEDLVEAEIAEMLSNVPISTASEPVIVATSQFIAAIHGAVSQITKVVLITPAADITPAAGHVPVPGTIDLTEV